MKFLKSVLFAASADLKPADRLSDDDYLITNHDFENGSSGWSAPHLMILREILNSVFSDWSAWVRKRSFFYRHHFENLYKRWGKS